MTEQRIILEMGMGVDLHGQDSQKAARRGIENTLRQVTLPIFGTLGIDTTTLRVAVTIAVPDPDQIVVSDLAPLFPHGSVTITPVTGGQRVANPKTGSTLVVATIAIEAFLPSETGNWALSGA